LVPDPSPSGESPTARLYRAALGDASAERYLPVLARFDLQGFAGPSWNGAAALLHLGWLIHHRLWLPLAVCSALGAALLLLGAALWTLAPGWPIGVKLGSSLALLLIFWLVPGLRGTAWLHERLRQRVIAAVAFAPTVDAACEFLRIEAHTRHRHNTWILAGVLCAGVVGGLLWLAVPWSRLGGDPNALVSTEAVAAVPAPRVAAVTVDQALLAEAVADGPVAPLAAEDHAEPESPPEVSRAEPVMTVVSPVPVAKPVEPAAVEAPAKVSSPLRRRPQGYGVAVGMFAVAANAERVMAQLKGADLPVISDAVASSRGELTRIRVGPFDQPAQAEAAAVKVKALGLEARVYAP
jgi:cell division septation protein DedD